ncbi:tRNA (adenosine(37)-N6)-threonylcarbamoyltransferase complex ATPase subunit type 1 TsaE [Chitinilyticum litopenaei]|uniref:tRNA (adenosine(37)-N6)-threonylcarbamoyltransferase complex ATPase subunit type 1 TsaE n=1 Tax=Chitinilyticum litopenaei TaxID=1121276 RepID=UPI00041C9FB0|nr:tRNA (adenosine(37)-N6)-threonylcarbamoyltransferase complex ATPase subunit type 1 TsaE [Chitinilyticum litopenaei]
MHSRDDTSAPAILAFHLADEAATLALGARLARVLHGGLVIELAGDLGAGKTTLTRGILRGLGFAGRVKSPTYTLVEPYAISNLYFYHFDLYRFNDPEEWEDAGFREHFNADSVCLIEWADKAAGLLPSPDWRITLSPDGEGRHAVLEAISTQGKACAARV